MTAIVDCTGACRSKGACDCGAMIGDTLKNPVVVHIPLMLKDAQTAGGPTPMQTIIDARTGLIDQSIIDAEAAKPEYANFKGQIARDGTPLDQHYARLNLLRSEGAARVEAAHDHMKHNLRNAHIAKDGRPLAVLTDSETARAAMMADMAKAWQQR